MKTFNDDPEGFFSNGGWRFLDPDSDVGYVNDTCCCHAHSLANQLCKCTSRSLLFDSNTWGIIVEKWLPVALVACIK